MKTLSAFTALLLLTCHCSAQPPPPSAAAPPAESQEYLEAHNQARSEVGVAALRWSPALAKSASLTVRLQRDKNNCSFANMSSNSNRYGANQLWAGGNKEAPRAVVAAWVKEKMFYNYEKNTCEEEQPCRTYTQVVWRNSAEVGCAQVACPKQQSSLSLCLYDPPGNVVGEKPY